MFTGYCKEENHPMKLEYYCKNHNQLYCSICLCKLNKFLYGQHKDCEVCAIQDIKDEKLSEKKYRILLRSFPKIFNFTNFFGNIIMYFNIFLQSIQYIILY